MAMYFDKKTKRHFIQFNYRGKTIKRRLPEGTTKEDADKLEVKIKHELFFESNGITARQETLWESFVDRVYLEHVAANNPANLEILPSQSEHARLHSLEMWAARRRKEVMPNAT